MTNAIDLESASAAFETRSALRSTSAQMWPTGSKIEATRRPRMSVCISSRTRPLKPARHSRSQPADRKLVDAAECRCVLSLTSPIPLSVDGVLARFRIFHDQPARGPPARLRPLPLRVTVIAPVLGPLKAPSSGNWPAQKEPLTCRTTSRSPSPSHPSSPAT